MALTIGELLRLRARAQGFEASERRSFLDVARASGGLQAQDASAGLLSARARTSGLTFEETRRARLEERTVVRTWAMRGTLHFLPAEDLGWLLPLLGPSLIARERVRREQLGLDDAAVERGMQILRDLLAKQGPATRETIRAALAAGGVPSEGQAVPHLLIVAALRGLICCSDDRGGGTYEFALLVDRAEQGSTLPRGAALEELARRYLGAAGPAAVEDFAAWSGLALRDAREGWDAIASERVAFETAAGTMWALRTLDLRRSAEDAGQPIVRLLPRFDTYLLSYRSRDLMLAAEHVRRVFPGGGILHASVLVDGRLAGVWRLQRARKQVSVLVEPFEPLPAEVREAIEAEASDLGGFFGLPAGVTYADTDSAG